MRSSAFLSVRGPQTAPRNGESAVALAAIAPLWRGAALVVQTCGGQTTPRTHPGQHNRQQPPTRPRQPRPGPTRLQRTPEAHQPRTQPDDSPPGPRTHPSSVTPVRHLGESAARAGFRWAAATGGSARPVAGGEAAAGGRAAVLSMASGICPVAASGIAAGGQVFCTHVSGVTPFLAVAWVRGSRAAVGCLGGL